jgi:hypothetical protein
MMNNFNKLTRFCIFIFFTLIPVSALATDWSEDLDGTGGEKKFRYIDSKKSITRGPCPYTCTDREIPKEYCKEWKSISKSEGGECYVQDLRISKDDAMPKNQKR